MSSFGKEEYQGAKSTLCTGCGHDSVTQSLITAFFQSGIDPYTVAKMSGIGCSSKTTAYFIHRAHGFNAIHGRMAPVSTGAKMANRELHMVGISGDGDTASIGLGGFAHAIRRNVPMLYVVENNGVYGLTKGQFSATADEGSTQKSGEANPFAPIDLCSLAIDLGCSFVARSFSGDAKQLVPLIDAALRHSGTAFIDVISPCVTFANHEGSTKSYDAVREHNVHLQELGFIQPQTPIEIDMEPGTREEIELFDGSKLILRKLAGHEHDVHDGQHALHLLHESRRKGEILTGLFYFNPQAPNLMQTLNMTEKPLSQLDQNELVPSASDLGRALLNFR